MSEIERRDVLRGGALGALVGAVGTAGVSEAATPGYQLAATSSATQQFFLAVKGIDGPSTTKGFEKQIPLHAFSWGVTNSAAPVGAGAGKATEAPFAFTSSTSKASPLFAKFVCTGEHIATAVLTGLRRNPAGVLSKYLKLTLAGVIVSSVRLGESGSGAAIDQVSLGYRTVTLVIDGVSMTFDFAANTP